MSTSTSYKIQNSLMHNLPEAGQEPADPGHVEVSRAVPADATDPKSLKKRNHTMGL
jgi:hypothetical protein